MKMITLAIRFLMLSIVNLNLFCSGTGTFDSTRAVDELETFVEATRKCRNTPGIIITVVRENAVIYEGGFGHTDLNLGEDSKATKNTLFPIGSVTKGFTTTVLAQVLSESNGSVTWDTPISEIIGDGFHFQDELRTKEANLRDLLSHKMGYPPYFSALLAGFPANTTLEDTTRVVSLMKPVVPLRTKFLYNNYMYAVAGYIAEKITGDTWENLVTKYIFKPLKMTNSGFVDRARDLSNMSSPFVAVNGELRKVNKELLRSVKGCGPAGSIYSTAHDMGKWIKFHLNRGFVDGEQLINEKLQNETYKEQFALPFHPHTLYRPQYPVGDMNIAYGMGWIQSDYRGFRKVAHSGGIITFSTNLWLFPDMDAGVFVASNGPLNGQDSMVTETIARRAADIVLNLDPWLNTSTSCSFPAPWGTEFQSKTHTSYEPNRTTGYSIPMNSFVGRYRDSAFGDILITPGEDDNYLSLSYGRFAQMNLYREAELQFGAVFKGDLWYVTGSDGTNNKWTVTFNHTAQYITHVLYPIDHVYNILYFKKLCDSNSQDVAADDGSHCVSRGISIHPAHSFIIALFLTLLFNRLPNLMVKTSQH